MNGIPSISHLYSMFKFIPFLLIGSVYGQCTHGVTVDTVFLWLTTGAEPVEIEIFQEAFVIPVLNGKGVTRDWAESKGFAIDEYDQYMQRTWESKGCATPYVAVGAEDRLMHIPMDIQQNVHDTLHIGGNFVKATDDSFEGWLTGELTIFFKQDSPPREWVNIQKKYSLLNGIFDHDGKQSFLIATTNLYKADEIISLSKALRNEPVVDYVVNQVASRAFAPQLE